MKANLKYTVLFAFGLISYLTTNSFAQSVFYSKSTGNLNSLSTWGTNTNGTGSAPSNFLNANVRYVLSNNNPGNISSSWTLGTNSKIIINSGRTFTIPTFANFTGRISVRNNGTLNILNFTTSSFSFDTLDINSHVIYGSSSGSSSTQGIKAGQYGRLTISNSSKQIVNNAGIVWARGGLIMSSSTLNLNLGSNNRLIIGAVTTPSNSDLRLIGNSTSDLQINGSGNLTPRINFISSITIDTLIINRSASGVVTLGSSLNIRSNLFLLSGFLALPNGLQVVVQGTASITRTNGRIRGGNNTTLFIAFNTTKRPATIAMDTTSSANQTIGTLQINNRDVILNTNLTVANSFNFITSSITLTKNDSIAFTGSCTISLSGNSHLYAQNGRVGYLTTASNVRIIPGTYRNLFPGNTARIFPANDTVFIHRNLFGGTLPAHTMTRNYICYAGDSIQSITPFTYCNLIFQGTTQRIFPSGTVSVDSLLILGNTNTFSFDVNNFIRYSGGNQTILPLVYSNLAFAGSGTKSFASSTDTAAILSTGSVLFENGVYTVNFPSSGRGIILRSTDTSNTAKIGSIPGTVTVTGRFTQQRYIPAIGRHWRYIGVPINGFRVGMIQAIMPVTGNFTNASSGFNIVKTSPSMYVYDTPSGTGSETSDPGWKEFPGASGSNTTNLTRGKGYAVFCRDWTDGSKLESPKLFSMNGTFLYGTFDFSNAYTLTNAGSAMNLLANPYPCPIDWDAASGWTKTNLSSTVYVRKRNRTMSSWNGVTGTNGGSRYISSTQAFYVQATGDSPSLIATESVKYTGSTSFLRKADEALNNELRIEFRDVNRVNSDEIVLYSLSGNDPLSISEKDAAKFINIPDPGESEPLNLSMIIGGKELAIHDAGFTFPENTSIPLNIYGTPEGKYEFSFPVFNNTSIGNVYLVDSYTQKITKITSGLVYSFDVDQSPLSKGSVRFSLVVKNNGRVESLSAESKSIELMLSPNPTQQGEQTSLGILNAQNSEFVTVNILDTKGISYFNQKVSSSGNSKLDIYLPTGLLKSGIYVVHVITSNGTKSQQRLVVQ